VYSFAEVGQLMLPLGNLASNEPLQLRLAWIDGKDAFLEATRVPREGYTLKVEKKGPHTVRLQFAAPTGSGEDREVRLSIPEVVQSKVTFESPAGSRYLYAVSGRGSQTVSPEVRAGAPAERPLKLECDLGRTALLHVRWRQEGREPQPPRLNVREAYLWKLHPNDSSLNAIYQYSLRQGVATTLSVDLPDGLEVRSVAAGRLPDQGPGSTLPRLKAWYIAPGNPRRLVLEFHRPLIRGAQVVFELVPRGLPLANAPLPLPSPRDARTTEGYLAFHAEGLEAQVAEHLRVNGLAARLFARVWDDAGMTDPGLAIQAYSFQRGGGPPVIRLSLAAAPSSLDSRQKITWRLARSGQADVSVVAHLRGLGRPLSFVEWDVPAAVQDIDVTGPDVRSWSRKDTRVQVWLSRPVVQTDVRLSAWHTLTAMKGAKLPPDAVGRLRITPFAVVGSGESATQLHVSAEEGLALVAEASQNLAGLPVLRQSDRELTYAATQPNYAVDVVSLDRPVQAEAYLLAFAELREQEFTYSALLNIQAGEARNVTLRLYHASDQEVQLEAPPALAPRTLPRASDRHGWTITVPAGVAYRLRVAASRPLKAGVQMPDLRVEGLTRIERYIAFAGRELRPEDIVGLTPMADVSERLRAWPAELDRIRRTGSAWTVRAEDWRLRLVPRSSTPQLGPSRILLADHAAAVVDGRRWLHRATYWIYHESDNDLHIELPSGAEVRALAIDDSELPLRPSATNVVWVPRSRLSGARALRVAWIFSSGEDLARPRLETPRLVDMVAGPQQWTVHVPSGFELTAPASTAATSSGARLDQERSLALLNLSGIIAEHEGANAANSSRLAAVQQLFYRYCRKAELGATGPASAETEALRTRNARLAESHGFEAVRRQAERQAALSPAAAAAADTTRPEATAGPDSFPAIERGTPAYWSAGRSDAPPVRLVAVAPRADDWTRRFAWVLLTLLPCVVVLVVPSPRLSSALRAFWPEEMLLLGCLGWAGLGPHWVFAFLVLLGVLGRFCHIAFWLGSFRLTRVAAPPSSIIRRPAP
jgi:hypothetical protein